MPPIGLAGKVDFSSLFIDLSGQHPAYAEAGKGLVLLGSLLNDILTFVIIAFVVSSSRRSIDHLQTQRLFLPLIPLATQRCAACCKDL